MGRYHGVVTTPEQLYRFYGGAIGREALEAPFDTKSVQDRIADGLEYELEKKDSWHDPAEEVHHFILSRTNWPGQWNGRTPVYYGHAQTMEARVPDYIVDGYRVDRVNLGREHAFEGSVDFLSDALTMMRLHR